MIKSKMHKLQQNCIVIYCIERLCSRASLVEEILPSNFKVQLNEAKLAPINYRMPVLDVLLCFVLVFLICLFRFIRSYQNLSANCGVRCSSLYKSVMILNILRCMKFWFIGFVTIDCFFNITF